MQQQTSSETDRAVVRARSFAPRSTPCRSIPNRDSRPTRARQRLAQYGPNQLTTEPPPSIWAVALGQLSNPMNIMLIIVAVASIAIGQVATGHLRRAARDVQRRHGLAPGAEGAGERRGARAAPGAARAGAAGRPRRADRVDRPGPGRHRAARGRRCRAGRRAHRRLGDARGAGSRAHRRERARREGRRDASRGRRRAR